VISDKQEDEKKAGGGTPVSVLEGLERRSSGRERDKTEFQNRIYEKPETKIRSAWKKRENFILFIMSGSERSQ